MKRSRFKGAAVVIAFSILVSACGGSAPEEATEGGTDQAPEPESEGASDEAPEPESNAGIEALDEALEDRDLVAQSLESAMSSDNARAAWDGDVLTIALDGDVDDELKSFQHCRVVGHFLEEGDTLILEFPNGSIDCADIPELEGELIW